MKKLPIEQCYLYAIASPKDLARRLSTKHCDVTAAELEALARDAGNFNVLLSRKNGKARVVQQLRPKLQRLHRRIHDLLSRVATPNYLHSAVAGQSYITNAAAHDCRVPAIKIDVKKFFQSVPRGAVYRFFAGPMRCNPEVAGLLGRLLTYASHLPTGGSASPLIAYYAFKEMFDAIHDLAQTNTLTMTCYVDDMTLSGLKASRSVLHQIRLLIAGHGLKSHKAKFLPANRPMVITGVAVTPQGLRVPNRWHRAICEGFKTYRSAADESESTKAFTRLVSRMHEAGQIEPRWKARAHTLQAEHKRKARRSCVNLSRPGRRDQCGNWPSRCVMSNGVQCGPVFLQDDEETVAILHEPRGLGVRIAMDDFGTGYSSLSYLRSFPFDKIKLDQSFVRDLAERPDCVAIVRSIAMLGHSLGMTTTAEGIETEEQLAMLKEAGFAEGQGYYFGRPKPANQLSLASGAVVPVAA